MHRDQPLNGRHGTGGGGGGEGGEGGGLGAGGGLGGGGGACTMSMQIRAQVGRDGHAYTGKQTCMNQGQW